VSKGRVRAQSCSAMEIRGSARHLLGMIRRIIRRGEKGESVLTRLDVSSLVVDRLSDEARGQNTFVTCFYFDFAARKEQSMVGVMGSLLRQAVNGIGRIPEEIWRAFQERKKALGGCGLQLVDILKILSTIASVYPTFMCLDGLDECEKLQRARLLDSLKEILEESPGTRIFVTGRPHIQAEVERHLAGHVTSVSISPKRGDITRYLHARLCEDTSQHAMDENFKADILQMIPENMSEMYVGQK